MANKQQSLRAKKQAKRANRAKAKAKAGRIERANVDGSLRGSYTEARGKKFDSIYDIINNRPKMKRMAEQGRGSDELFTRETFFAGINDAIDLTVKLHSGMEVYDICAQRQLLTPTQEGLDLIVAADKCIVQFCEDVHAVKTLDEAKHQPVDYIDLVLHIADVMQQLMDVYRQKLLDLFETHREVMETYAQEHLPSEFQGTPEGMHAFQHQLHGERIDRVSPLYATGEAKDIMDHMKEMEELFKDDPELEHPTDQDNLPLTASEEPGVLGEEPNDPVTQAQ
ncbi:hypothetical protein D3C81_287390 [compost metagenome]